MLMNLKEFPGGPVVRLCVFNTGGLGFDPWSGVKRLQAEQHGQKKKRILS